MSIKDLPRYSSSLGKSLVHISFKVKYCHKLFLNLAVRNRCEEIFWNVVSDYGFDVQEMGFDDDHVHLVVDLGMKWTVQQIVKALKGCSGRYLKKEFPWLRKKLLRKNRFWSPAYFFDSVGKDENTIKSYVRNQKLSRKKDEYQKTLFAFNSS